MLSRINPDLQNLFVGTRNMALVIFDLGKHCQVVAVIIVPTNKLDPASRWYVTHIGKIDY